MPFNPMFDMYNGKWILTIGMFISIYIPVQVILPPKSLGNINSILSEAKKFRFSPSVLLAASLDGRGQTRFNISSGKVTDLHSWRIHKMATHRLSLQ